MAETIGAKLRAARQARGLSVEDAAHETRIHTKNIRGLENDDYSGFANITYAKSFLSLYSRFLKVEADDVLGQFAGNEATAFAGNGQSFLQPIGERIESGPRPSIFHSSKSVDTTSPGGAPILLGLVLLLLLVAIPTLWYLGKDAESPEEVTTKLKEFANAQLTESEPGAANEDGKEPEPAATPSDPKTAPKKSSTKEPSSAEPKGPPRARPISSHTTASVSVPPRGKMKGARSASSPQGAATEYDVRTRQPVSRPEKPQATDSEDTSSDSPPATAATPIRAMPLIARPMVIPSPETETTEETASEETDSQETDSEETDSEETDSEERKNRYPRPE